MLYTIMRHVRNFFVDKGYDGTFKIENGTIDLSFLQSGQYFLVEGSVFNDGVYQYNNELKLTDEEFTGRITALKPSKEFLELVKEIEEFNSKRESDAYVSESFGGYSYTKATNKNGMPATWQDVFSSKLKVWRKV